MTPLEEFAWLIQAAKNGSSAKALIPIELAETILKLAEEGERATQFDRRKHAAKA